MRRILRPAIIIRGAGLFCILALGQSSKAQDAGWTLEVELHGQQIQGTPVEWNENEVLLLGRDGHLSGFAPSEVGDFRKTSDSFRPYSSAEMRRALQAEFGRNLEVSSTRHYIVAHPPGESDLWAERFEQLYRSFHHYFTARGFSLQTPQFPMVAIVFANQNDYRRYASRTGVQLSPGVIGYYSILSNRVAMYDLTEGSGVAEDWRHNAETIIHEAAHQSAFNTGLHNRFAPPPLWIVEGLGTMFEASGVNDARRHPHQADRINPARLAALRRRLATGRPADTLAALVSSDRLFQTNPDAAYAEAWALTFYLVETNPRGYARLLSRTAELPPLESYSSQQRLRDFAEIFGTDFTMLDARLLRFIDSL